MSQDITFIIVTYNSEKVIENTLRSLPRDQKIMVLDNGSRDRTVEMVARYDFVEIIKNNNIGYGKAANIGFSRVTTPYAILLNPDVKLCVECINAMLDCAKRHPDIGIVGARMFYYEKGIKCYEEAYVFDQNNLCYSNWIVGALMLFKMDVLRKLGGFDENIFLFFEETDLCDKFAQAGYKLAICGDASAEHDPGTSSASSIRTVKIRAWHSAWSRAYYYKKHYGPVKLAEKSLSKIMKNLFNIPKNLVCAKKMKMLANFYEILGLLSFFMGIKAYRPGGTGRMT